MHCGQISDLITGSSLAVLALVATSGKAMAKLGVADRFGQLYGTDHLGMLGYVVFGWFVVKAYHAFMMKCPTKMSDPRIEQGLIVAGLALGAVSYTHLTLPTILRV